MAFTPTSGPNESALAYESEGGGDPKKGWHRLSKWFSRESDKPPPKESATPERDASKPGLGRRISRRVVPGLPRPATFKRINSERRERLTPVQPAADEKRALSVDRRKLMKGRPRSLPPNDAPRISAPAVCGRQESVVDEETDAAGGIEPPSLRGDELDLARTDSMISPTSTIPEPQTAVSEPLPSLLPPFSPEEHPHPPPSPPLDPPDSPLDDIDEDVLRAEHEDRWILNLSMHFRDRSPREKFFVTYAETRIKWRRITVSVDYRNAPPDSLERDLQNLSYQRDKSFRIYESIRTSLPDIQWYDTVTNLRLETSADDRLHVHVTEDINEIISYPSVRLLDHIDPIDIPRIPERDVEFDEHMSGFVYKVRVQDKTLIKKEIPGPDSVEEFLYEVNALYALIGSTNVVQFEGLVVDDDEGLVKGILIAYAEHGPLVDIIYDRKNRLSWDLRQRWAWQIVNGLAEIHESGFVQGDFTLSNIVIDENDAAVIIDINRRGCPVGWEPPEIARMIQSGQRISMYIGVKSDLFQLGMVLWALAEEEDEPERRDRPLSLEDTALIPQYFKDMVAICLDNEPRQRESAKSLLARFPEIDTETPSTAPLQRLLQPAVRRNPSETPYIDPRAAVGHADLPARSRSRHSRSRVSSRSRGFSDSRTYIEGRPSSTDIPFDGPSSCIVPRRGRSPPTNSTHVRPTSLERRRPASVGDDDDDDPEPQLLTVSPSNELKWEELVDTDGTSFLVETEEDPIERQARIRRSAERMRQTSLTDSALKFAHVDSGLGDMDGISRRSSELGGLGRASTGFSMHRASTGLSLGRGSRYPGLALRSQDSPTTRHVPHTDSGLADMDLAGVGGNEALMDYGHHELELDIGEQPSDLVTVGEDEVVQDFTSDAAHADSNGKAPAALGMHAEGELRPATETDIRQSIAATAADTHGANGVE